MGQPKVTARLDVDIHRKSETSKGGRNMMALEEETSTNIHVAKDSERVASAPPCSKLITIEGDLPSRTDACNKITTILLEGLRPRLPTFLRPEDASFEDFFIPNWAVSLLIGPNGSTIRLIEASFNVRITIGLDQEPRPNTYERRITMAGHKEAIPLCVDYLDTFIRGVWSAHQQREGPPPPLTCQVVRPARPMGAPMTSPTTPISPAFMPQKPEPRKSNPSGFAAKITILRPRRHSEDTVGLGSHVSTWGGPGYAGSTNGTFFPETLTGLPCPDGYTYPPTHENNKATKTNRMSLPGKKHPRGATSPTDPLSTTHAQRNRQTWSMREAQNTKGEPNTAVYTSGPKSSQAAPVENSGGLSDWGSGAITTGWTEKPEGATGWSETSAPTTGWTENSKHDTIPHHANWPKTTEHTTFASKSPRVPEDTNTTHNTGQSAMPESVHVPAPTGRLPPASKHPRARATQCYPTPTNQARNRQSYPPAKNEVHFAPGTRGESHDDDSPTKSRRHSARQPSLQHQHQPSMAPQPSPATADHLRTGLAQEPLASPKSPRTRRFPEHRRAMATKSSTPTPCPSGPLAPSADAPPSLPHRAQSPTRGSKLTPSPLVLPADHPKAPTPRQLSPARRSASPTRNKASPNIMHGSPSAPRQSQPPRRPLSYPHPRSTVTRSNSAPKGTSAPRPKSVGVLSGYSSTDARAIAAHLVPIYPGQSTQETGGNYSPTRIEAMPANMQVPCVPLFSVANGGMPQIQYLPQVSPAIFSPPHAYAPTINPRSPSSAHPPYFMNMVPAPTADMPTLVYVTSQNPSPVFVPLNRDTAPQAPKTATQDQASAPQKDSNHMSSPTKKYPVWVPSKEQQASPRQPPRQREKKMTEMGIPISKYLYDSFTAQGSLLRQELLGIAIVNGQQLQLSVDLPKTSDGVPAINLKGEPSLVMAASDRVRLYLQQMFGEGYEKKKAAVPNPDPTKVAGVSVAATAKESTETKSDHEGHTDGPPVYTERNVGDTSLGESSDSDDEVNISLAPCKATIGHQPTLAPQ